MWLKSELATILTSWRHKSHDSVTSDNLLSENTTVPPAADSWYDGVIIASPPADYELPSGRANSGDESVMPPTSFGNKQAINIDDFNSTYHVAIEESHVSIMW